MGNNRTVTKWPGSSQENSEGVFHLLAYKREYSIKKIGQFGWRLCLALFCQSVKW